MSKKIERTTLMTLAMAFMSTGAWAAEEAAAPPVAGEAPAEEAAPAEGEAAAPAEATTDEVPPPTGDADGARFRWGISGGGGLLSVSDTAGNSASGFLGTFDMRFGVQINDMIAIYAQPQLGGYGLSNATISGGGGVVGASALVDFTFVDQFFVAGGLGYGVLNNPSGLELHFRGGMYPLLGGGQTEARRRALSLGVDFRVFLLDGITGISPTLSIGYESF